MKHMFTGLMAAVATVLAGPAGAAPLEKSRVSFSGNYATAYYSSYDEAGVYRSWQVRPIPRERLQFDLSWAPTEPASSSHS